MKKSRKKRIKKHHKKRLKKTGRRRRLSRKKFKIRSRRKKAFRKLYRKSKKKSKRIKKPKRKLTKKRVLRRSKKPKRRTAKRRVKRLARRKKGISRAGGTVRSSGSFLERLFESPAKVQVMKLFFRNPEEGFSTKDIKKRLRINLSAIKKELKKLERVGLLKTRRISARKQVFSINPGLDFFNELRDLILKSAPVSKDKLLKAIKGLGRIRLILLSGLFVGNSISRADLLIVGDNINSRKLGGFIKNLESEAGTDIRCVVMTTEEFNYRYDMYDRFVRDLLEDKCELLVNKLGL